MSPALSGSDIRRQYTGALAPVTAIGTEVEITLAFDAVYRMLRQRIELLLALLLSSFDGPTLQNRLYEIDEAQP